MRALEPVEAQLLVNMTRTARDRVRLRRAGIVLTSVQGRSAAMFAATPKYALEVIHAFSEQALDQNGAAAGPANSARSPAR